MQSPRCITSRDNVQQERRGTHLGRRKRCERHDSEKGRPASLSGRGVKQRNAADNAGDGKHVTRPVASGLMLRYGPRVRACLPIPRPSDTADP